MGRPDNFSHAPRRSIFVVLSAAVLLASPSGARAEPPKVAPEAVRWTVTSIFEKNAKNDDFKDQPRLNLSGAACVPTTPKFTACLIANDEKKYAQFFSINGTAMTPRQLIRLSDADKDPDAEGVAYADGYFYVTGSHGRSRNSDKDNDSSYAVFRFPVDRATGVPQFSVTEEKVVGVKSSPRLREVLSTATEFKTSYNTRLNDGGLNIEGIAVKAGRMHFGLRGPSAPAYIVSVDADAMFTKNDLKPVVTPLALGDNTGIRDLAAVDGGILLLTGPMRSESVPYAVWLWDGVGKSAKQLATLDLAGIGTDGKAEILLPLAEETSGYRVLVMFDGIENGGPVSFLLPR